jgi:hypothetical protein
MHSDPESGLPHVAHELFNLMAQIELWLQDHPHIDASTLLKFNQPPQDHKTVFTSQDNNARALDATRGK